MIKVTCPNCNTSFDLDQSQYDALLADVKNAEFKRELDARSEEIKKRFEAEKSENEIKLNAEIEILKNKLNTQNINTELEVNKVKNQYTEMLSKNAIEITKLQNSLANANKDSEVNKATLKESYEIQLRLKDEEIEKWKNFRISDSTKDLGESLENYCKEAFDQIRADAYPNAYFEKDNEVFEGSKGDFVFKDFKDGIEILSIMFEMKNQKDDTEHKHKNEDFFKKLDSDRNKKGCEYAVLVSTLEDDSKLYNKGIVDVSYKYQKMYVVRPQFFLAIIGLLRNMALNNFTYKQQVVLYENEHMDIANFESSVKAVTDKITADYAKAGAIYSEVDEMCEKIIKNITAFREKFRIAAGHLGAAQNQLDNLSVRKLTKNNPTMQQKFAELKK